ncbi:MAG: hypothetical protein IJF47_00145, partial [Candidatus Methanomethylophilaceae archaeon]|nr:hypothetical protein [Candidatus Methanomethylophilaceae archaeon]
GLVSESEKVSEKIDGFDCVALALGLEEIEILKTMDSQEWEYDPTNLDSVYAHHLKKFGEVNIPVPAFKTAIDICKEKGIEPFPLDMCDEEFTKMYCECVSTFDFLKEKKVLKKSMKTEFSDESPEKFVLEWDALINTLKGQYAVSLRREEYIAKQIKDLANYRKKILAIIEYERVKGILIELGVEYDM